MELLYLLEGIRTPFWDTVLGAITLFGEETLFILLAVILFWCVDKRGGYYMMATGFIGVVANQFLKLWFRIPRPWVRDPNFTIVESAREAASGYSFPSGHTQAVMSSLGVPAVITKKPWLRIACIALIALTAFSRMYLGVHTPADVGVSLIVGAVLLAAIYPVFYAKGNAVKRIYILFTCMIGLAVLFLLFTELYPFPADIDAENYESGIKNAYTMLGVSLALLISLHIDRKYIRFKTQAPLWAQLIKVVGGLALLMLIRILLKQPLLTVFGGHHAADAIRYFLMMLFAGCIWPLTFKLYQDKGKKS
ncbi:MAG: phosphatase PAP2 family protein [Oscillospiraceae bacterium]|nr:phosphatase PAP2 family protein [Oscillospiraceae bacterium]